MTSTLRTITRLPLGALTAAGLMVGIAVPALAATPTSSAHNSPADGTSWTRVSKILGGSARIVDGRFQITPGMPR